LNPEPFFQVAHRELSQVLYDIHVTMSLVQSLPDVEAKLYLDSIYLNSIRGDSDRYWIPWTEQIGVWINCDGRSVSILVSEGFDNIEVESSLANCMTAVVLGACLNLQGRIAIHANAVALENVAAAFVGYSGRGKSTLTAYCLSRGAGFVTDDVLSVEPNGLVHLGCPRLKLYPHTGESFGLPATEDTDYKIHYHPEQLGGLVKEHPIPLGIIYLLEESPDNNIYSEQLSPSQAVFDLLTHSYYASQLISHNHVLLDAYVRLVNQTPVKKLFYPRNFGMLPKVYDFLLEEIQQL